MLVSLAAEVEALASSSVVDYGAVPNDGTPDAAAITAALAASNGVYFPARTYDVSASIVVRSGTRIHGEGPASILKKTSGVFGIIAGREVTNVVIENLKLIGDHSGTTGRSTRKIRATASTLIKPLASMKSAIRADRLNLLRRVVAHFNVRMHGITELEAVAFTEPHRRLRFPYSTSSYRDPARSSSRTWMELVSSSSTTNVQRVVSWAGVDGGRAPAIATRAL